MKVLTAAQMREVDRRTMELGIGGPILMENAGHRVVEFLEQRFAPLSRQRVLILCGKGNNGGDGYVVARQLLTRFRPAALWVVAVGEAERSEPRRMFEAAGGTVLPELTPEMQLATLVIDGILGTGIAGEARGASLAAIQAINTGFPLASVVAIDVPSGMNTGSGSSAGEVARADATVTFTAPKLCHALAPNCDRLGELWVGHIGSPARLMDDVQVHLSGPSYFRDVTQKRSAETNKGSFGHVLVVGGDHGKSGAAEMTGLAALRSGAGLVTVASSVSRLAAPELMTDVLPRTWDELRARSERQNVIAIGPGLGAGAEKAEMVRSAVAEAPQAVVVDADGLNCLAGSDWQANGIRVLTPHPGEMSRLLGRSVAEVQKDRLAAARELSAGRGCILVLKGHRTVVAMPDGRAWINPTGSPALAKGGTGDILTGIVAAMLAQHPGHPGQAVLAAVWLHGRAGELGAAKHGERGLLATELLPLLKEAFRECQNVPDAV